MGTLGSHYLTFVDARESEKELARNLQIRAANLNDLTEICEIEEASFSSDPYPEFLIRRLLNDKKSLFLVATRGNEIVGYLVSRMEVGTAHLISLAVQPRERRSGTATQLVDKLSAALRKSGVREIRLEVRLDNKGAIELYARLRFREERVLPQYYSDGSPALLMRKVIE